MNVQSNSVFGHLWAEINALGLDAEGKIHAAIVDFEARFGNEAAMAEKLTSTGRWLVALKPSAPATPVDPAHAAEVAANTVVAETVPVAEPVSNHPDAA